MRLEIRDRKRKWRGPARTRTPLNRAVAANLGSCMRFSHFFIERPIFAMVISIVIVIAGLLAYVALPTAQYPEIAPPTVQVTANYPGADPKVIAETVATPIEEQVNGVENMLYMSSQSTADGSMTLTVTFK